MPPRFRVFLSAVTSECGEARKLVASDLRSRGLGAAGEAREALAAGRAIIAELVERFPDWAEWKRDLAWFDG
jgi:hypothetical protein